MPKRVIIADDSEFFRSALREILTGAGFVVVGEAADGDEAVELALALAPDMAVLDVVMPVMNGFEAARRILELDPGMKVVICSSLGFDPMVEEASEAGASAYIAKPLDEAEVVRVFNGLA